jgi:hypothetical protein
MTYKEFKNLKENDKVKVLDNSYYSDNFLFRELNPKPIEETQKMIGQIYKVEKYGLRDKNMRRVTLYTSDNPYGLCFYYKDLELVKE